VLDGFERALGVRFAEAPPTDAEVALAEELLGSTEVVGRAVRGPAATSFRLE
jgi:hypothetical protein